MTNQTPNRTIQAEDGGFAAIERSGVAPAIILKCRETPNRDTELFLGWKALIELHAALGDTIEDIRLEYAAP